VPENISVIQDESVYMSETLHSAGIYLLADLWTLIRTEYCSEYLVTALKHHMKTMNLLYSLNQSTYTVQWWTRAEFEEGGLRYFYTRVCLSKGKYQNLRQKAAVCASLFRSSYICE